MKFDSEAISRKTEERFFSSGLQLKQSLAFHACWLSAVGTAYAGYVRFGEMSDGDSFDSDTSWFDDYTVLAGTTSVSAAIACISLIAYGLRPEVRASELERRNRIRSEVLDDIDRRTS